MGEELVGYPFMLAQAAQEISIDLDVLARVTKNKIVGPPKDLENVICDRVRIASYVFSTARLVATMFPFVLIRITSGIPSHLDLDLLITS